MFAKKRFHQDQDDDESFRKRNSGHHRCHRSIIQITEKSIQQIRESDMQLSNLVQAGVSFASSTFEVELKLN